MPLGSMEFLTSYARNATRIKDLVEVAEAGVENNNSLRGKWGIADGIYMPMKKRVI